MNSPLQNKVALITGGASGIGQACALAFAREGAKVVIADLADAEGEATVAQVQQLNGEALFQSCNVTVEAEVQDLIEIIVNRYGRLDYACNNAGIEGVQAPTAEYPEAAWQQVLGVNLTGVWLCMKYELQQMSKQHGGAIVNMASILGKVGFPNAVAYVAAKHGVIGITKTAALEYASQDIRVNAVCPGFIDTPMLNRGGVAPGTPAHEAVRNLHPVKRLGKPEEIAEAVIWLCSDAASFVTGATLLADGGYVAQ